MDNQYKSSAASLFAAIAREAVTIWAYCQHCGVRTEQTLCREDARFEYYRCACGAVHEYAVR